MTSTFIPELDRLIEIYDQATTLAEIKTLAAQIEQIIHDDGMWINGWATPFYRGAYWRYVKWPADFNGAATSNPEELFVLWIDPAARAEIERARRTGQTYPAELQIFDQFKSP
jgi:microcin C transport system substrate-binding protein